MQLDIFSLVPDCSSRELPSAKFPLEPKIEEALKPLEELAKLAIKPKLVEGCTVRSSVTFKEKAGIFLKFEDYAGCNLALVRYEYRGSMINYYCTIATLEVVK